VCRKSSRRLNGSAILAGFADMIASHIELSIPDKQALLATLDPVRRLERVGDLLQAIGVSPFLGLREGRVSCQCWHDL